MRVELNRQELWQAAMLGVSRTLESRGAGRQDPAGGAWSFDKDILGAIGEIAFAKGVDRYPRWGINDFKNGPADVSGAEVRATTHRDGCLIVRPDDHDDRTYVLAVISREDISKVDLVGWIKGHNAKNPAWLQAPNGRPEAFFVPQWELTPL